MHLSLILFICGSASPSGLTSKSDLFIKVTQCCCGSRVLLSVMSTACVNVVKQNSSLRTALTDATLLSLSADFRTLVFSKSSTLKINSCCSIAVCSARLCEQLQQVVFQFLDQNLLITSMSLHVCGHSANARFDRCTSLHQAV